MSVQALSWVLDHSDAVGAERLILISLANHAGKNPVNGAWESYPGIKTICREAGLSRERTATDALTAMEADGRLERVVNGAPDERIRRDRRPNLYRILIPHGVTCSDTPCRECADGVSDTDGTGCRVAPNGVSESDATGCRDATGKPSFNPSEEPPPNRRPSKDERMAVVEEAVKLAVDQVIAVNRPENPGAYRAAVTARLTRAYKGLAQTLAHEGNTADVIAQAILDEENPLPPQPAEPDPPKDSMQQAAYARMARSRLDEPDCSDCDDTGVCENDDGLYVDCKCKSAVSALREERAV